MTQYTQLFASRKDQGARTPSYLIQLAKDTFLPKTARFFDPCPADWTPESSWDALDRSQPWGDFNFVNPPFDKTALFYERAIEQQDRAVSVFLVPCRFHTRFFARALPHIRRIGLINERIKFVGYKTPLQAAMCFVVFGPVPPVVASVDAVNIAFHVSSRALTVADVIPEGGHLLHGAVSEPLRKILDTNEPNTVVCPARLDNKVLLRAITSPNAYALFLCPTLRSTETKHKYLEGSLLLSLRGASVFPHLEGHVRVPTNLLTPSTREHSEEEYAALL